MVAKEDLAQEPHLALLDNASDDEIDPELVQAADKTFTTKISKRTRALILVAVVAAFLVSFSAGSYEMSLSEIVQCVGSVVAKFLYLLPGYLDDWVHYITQIPQYISQAIQGTGQFPPLPSMDIPLTNGERVLFKIRLPRILVVMLVGASLAVAGASYQGMFKNPLTSPDLLGASAGASLGACIALLLSLPGTYVQLFAFLGGLLAVSIALWLNRLVDYDPTLGLVLAGILVSTLFQSGMSIVKFMADADDKLPTITFWLMGSFANVNFNDLLLCLLPMLIGFSLLLSHSWKLNVLSFGDEEARSMGVNTRKTRLLVILASTLITGISVAVAGIVGWIGLVIPHLARAIVGPNYKVLLPTSMFVGAIYLLIVDDLARLLATVEIPIGILTAILGVPFFVFIFKHNMKGWK